MVKPRKNKFLVEAKKSEVEVIPVVSPRQSIQPQDMSLDQKVDRYFIQYEREAIKKSEMFNGLGQTPRASAPLAIAQLQENKKGLNLFSILFEQDEDPTAGGMDMGGEEGGGEEGGGEEVNIQEPQLNIQRFASNVARLVNNYDVMLDPKTVILNRAYAYLLKNYNEQTAIEFMVNMKKYYQLTPNNIGANIPTSTYPSAVGNANEPATTLTAGTNIITP
jgi:hypothetical protein